MKTSKSNINEKKLSKAELNRREEIIKDLKGNKREFVKRYGGDAEKVMYARATNIAKKQAETMNPESANKIKEAIKTALMGPVKEKKEFPDLTGDGKVTKADILKGRGVELKEEFQEPNEEAYAITFLEYLKKDGKDSKYADRVATLMRAYTGKVFESLNEGDLDVGHQDDEPHMIRANLYHLGKYATDLLAMLKKYDDMKGEVDFPHWWQAKITKALDYMEKAKHYLENEEALDNIDAMTDRVMENVLKRLK